MSIKIKFSHKELCHRAAIVLGLNPRDIISVVPTEGGRKFFVEHFFGQVVEHFCGHGIIGYRVCRRAATTITIWQLVDAEPLADAIGSVEANWSNGLSSILEILGLKKMPRSEQELKKAYRKAVFNAHPDHGGNEDLFRELQTAYESIMIMLPNLRGNL